MIVGEIRLIAVAATILRARTENRCNDAQKRATTTLSDSRGGGGGGGGDSGDSGSEMTTDVERRLCACSWPNTIMSGRAGARARARDEQRWSASALISLNARAHKRAREWTQRSSQAASQQASQRASEQHQSLAFSLARSFALCVAWSTASEKEEAAAANLVARECQLKRWRK